MDLQTLRTFFLWCTIIDMGLLMLTFLMFAFARDWIYRIHSKWFPISRESFDMAIYALMGGFKIAVFVFNVVPCVALHLVG